MSNPIVRLSDNSVYISTTSMISDGFHWSLYITGHAQDGKATRHNWAQVGLVEKYRSKIIDPTTIYSANNVVLAYLKIAVYMV